jgi:hypothetical protein
VETLAGREPFSQRFTATISDDGNTITGRWEIAEDATNLTTRPTSTSLNHPGVKAAYKALAVAAILATVKHPGFSEEREWRLITAFQDIYGEGLGLHSIPTKFRPSAVGLSACIELSVPMDAVLTVRIGPGDRAEIREAVRRRASGARPMALAEMRMPIGVIARARGCLGFCMSAPVAG